MIPADVRARLEQARDGRVPWTATLRPAELAIVRSHGLRPVAAVSSTCWMHYGWSWTEGHAQGWDLALDRLREEAVAAGANAVLDVRMRTVPFALRGSMDFTLLGTAVRVDAMSASRAPLVATVPALEFVRLLEADIVPTGIAVGARYEWIDDWGGRARQTFGGNVESTVLSELWTRIRRQAQADLRLSAARQGNGVLAHVNFSQMFEAEGGENRPRRYLARHIIIGTVIDGPSRPVPHRVRPALDLRGASPLKGRPAHHSAYDLAEREGGI